MDIDFVFNTASPAPPADPWYFNPDWWAGIGAIGALVVAGVATRAAFRAAHFARLAWLAQEEQVKTNQEQLRKADLQLEIAEEKRESDRIQHSHFRESIETQRRLNSPLFGLLQANKIEMVRSMHFEPLDPEDDAIITGCWANIRAMRGFAKGSADEFIHLLIRNRRPQNQIVSLNVSLPLHDGLDNGQAAISSVGQIDTQGGQKTAPAKEIWLVRVPVRTFLKSFPIVFEFETIQGYQDAHEYEVTFTGTTNPYYNGELDRTRPQGIKTFGRAVILEDEEWYDP